MLLVLDGVEGWSYKPVQEVRLFQAVLGIGLKGEHLPYKQKAGERYPHPELKVFNSLSGCSSIWLERAVRDREVVGSSPVIQTAGEWNGSTMRVS